MITVVVGGPDPGIPVTWFLWVALLIAGMTFNGLLAYLAYRAKSSWWMPVGSGATALILGYLAYMQIGMQFGLMY